MLPVLAIPDPADARVVFDVLNDALTNGDHDAETRKRLCLLLIAAHSEMTATTNNDDKDN